ncbi:ABC transporter permease [Paraburkholderia sp.]|uniref:ABC transporter permease n=1 Tax=Paraburkholderia sp. TaxID=1926495 RepID=UPI003C7E71D9
MDSLVPYGPQLVYGAFVTLKLALCVLVFGLSGGLLLAGLKTSRYSFVRVPIDLVTSMVRGVPEFLIILVIYFGLAMLIETHFNSVLQITPFAGGVTALTIVFAAFSSEVFRGAFSAVPSGQIEAADAYGLSKIRTFALIRLPQAWRICLPSINNMWQSVVKDTSLVSVIGLEDLLKRAGMAGQYTRQPMLFYCAAAAIYFLMLAVSNPLFKQLERRASRGYSRT